MFKRTISLEYQKIQLALKNSVSNVMRLLPDSVLDMSAEEFLLKTSEDPDFENRYNLEF